MYRVMFPLRNQNFQPSFTIVQFCACSDLSLYRKRILPYGRYVLLHKNINFIKLYINYIKNNARTLIKLFQTILIPCVETTMHKPILAVHGYKL